MIEPLAVNFTENSATFDGGVIFFEDGTNQNQMCFGPIERNCSIEFSSWIDVNSLNFENNRAERAGRIFYGGNLDTCTPIINGYPDHYQRALNVISSVSNMNVSANNYNDNTTSNVSSDPLQVCICKSDNMVTCDYKEIETVRGREFTFPAVIVGQGLGAVPSAVRISLDNNAQTGPPTQRIQRTGKACTNIAYNFFAESDTTVVTLFPDTGICREFGIGGTPINITFLPCPSGFMKTGSRCACEERLQHFNAVCNVDDETIQWISASNRFWMGVLFENASNESTYQGLILHSGCPLDYCVDDPVPITLDNLDISM